MDQNQRWIRDAGDLIILMALMDEQSGSMKEAMATEFRPKLVVNQVRSKRRYYAGTDAQLIQSILGSAWSTSAI